ncbi:MAG: hypothetical protein AB7V13_08040 [Pseudorhodoplanes sp.]|uniref:hypothetical protein n=1 Tax=Pseudorhodoplanes sp. TaxID=1934341 RepID=UPI003D098D68
MNKPILALAAACFAVMLAMPVQADAKSRPGGSNAGERVDQTTEISSRRRWRHRHWGYRRAYWGPRYRYWGPRYRYWGPRRVWWGPRRAYWGPRYYAPRRVYWAPPYYWRPRPVIGIGFGPRWWW